MNIFSSWSIKYTFEGLLNFQFFKSNIFRGLLIPNHFSAFWQLFQSSKVLIMLLSRIFCHDRYPGPRSGSKSPTGRGRHRAASKSPDTNSKHRDSSR